MERKNGSPGEDEGDHPMRRLNFQLSILVVEARRSPHSEEGRRAFERLTVIVRSPAQRIARAKLEEYLPRDQVGIEEINAVVSMSLYELYRRLGQYRLGTPVVPWLATIVSSCAQKFARHHPAA